MSEVTKAAVLRLEGAPNFRELGGIRTSDGREVAAGRVFRSDAFLALSDAEWQLVAALEIRTVCDLRSPGEREKHQVTWPGPAPELLALPILADVRTTGPEVMDRIASDPTGWATRELLLENYASFPAAFAPGFRRLVDTILADGTPVLINCMAGKDRTGFACALLLLALGVAYDDVVDDYLKSNDVFDPELVSATVAASLNRDAPLSDATLEALKCQVEYLDSALAAAVDSHGDIRTYLEEACGLTPERHTALRSALLCST